jgi:NAD(P)-dependent dehydrogenase (short-subunit alcohol dehydrogenase family)
MKITSSLKGKSVLITGAAGVLGIEHSISLISAGAKVIMTDIDDVKLSIAKEYVYKKTGLKAHSYIMDITKSNSIHEIKKKLDKKKIFIFALINNAAIDHKVSKISKFVSNNRLEEFNPNIFEAEVKVGLTGAILCSSIFGPEMAKKRDGVIINIASDMSVISPDQRLYMKKGVSKNKQRVKPVSYSIIKSGLVGLTRYLATYWAEFNVRSNAVSFGGVYDDQNKDFVTKLEKLIPLGRMAQKDEYRGIIKFLCSDDAKYINGQNIVIDGGRSII